VHSLAGVEADDRLRKSEDGNAAIVKAAPKLRQRFCLFLRVDRIPGLKKRPFLGFFIRHGVYLSHERYPKANQKSKEP
jgi:hypothetical protein